MQSIFGIFYSLMLTGSLFSRAWLPMVESALVSNIDIDRVGLRRIPVLSHPCSSRCFKLKHSQ